MGSLLNAKPKKIAKSFNRVEIKIHDTTNRKTRVIRSEDKGEKNNKRSISPLALLNLIVHMDNEFQIK